MKRLAIMTTVVLLLCAAPAQAETVAVSISGGSSISADGDTNGWRFLANQQIDVVKLGAWDKDDDGLPAQVDVGIWKDDGTLLSSVTLPSGTAAPLTDGFRYASITPVALVAGDYYRIGSVALSGDIGWKDEVTVTTAPAITFDVAYYDDSAPNTLTFPNAPEIYSDRYFGPNFQFVPEPGSIVLLSMAGVGLLCFRRR